MGTSGIPSIYYPLPDTRQESFCRLYFDGTRSGESACREAGYSPKTSRSQACNLLTRDSIIGRIQALQEQAASARVMSVQERRERLSEIARARLTDYICAGPDGDQINLGPESPNTGAIAEISSKTVYGKGAGENDSPAVVTRIKLHSPIAAIQELNKMEGMYPAKTYKVEHFIEQLSDEQLAVIAAGELVGSQ